MKLTIQPQVLQRAVSNVYSIISTKTALPILANIMLESDNKGLKLTATDLKISMECRCEAEVKLKGKITVPGAKLMGIVRELPDLSMSLELLETDVLYIECGKVKYRLNGVSPEEFPELPVFEGSKELTLDKEILKQLLEKVSFAVSTDQTRYVLTGVLFDISPDAIVAVATDGRRLSYGKIELEEKLGFSERVIIPDKTVHELEKLVVGGGEVLVSFAENQLSFQFDDINLVSRLIEGNFPDYENVIPKGYENRLTVGTEDIMHTIRRAAVVASQKSNMVRMVIEGNQLEVVCSTPEVGEAREEVSVEYKGENVEIGFNPDYILDVLKHVDDESVVFELKDGVSPGLLRPGDDNRFTYVIMPVKLD